MALMNNVAIIADVHGNLEALEAVLKDIRSKGIEKIINLGDLIDYGPDSIPCLEMSRDFDINLIGNHEGAILGLCRPSFTPHGYTSYKMLTRELQPRHIDIFKDRKPFAMYSNKFINCYMMHGSIDDYLWGKFDFDRAVDLVKNHGDHKKLNIFISAHTHKPVEISKDNVIHVNPGSVGQPRDNIILASYSIMTYASDSPSVYFTHVRIPYEVKKTQAKMKKKGSPAYLIYRLEKGL